MSIATDITGGAGGSAAQLLAVLSDPTAYQAKIQAMEQATAEYKKYVDAVGVATEVVSLRDDAAALKQQAQDAADAAKAKAKEDLQKAKAKADALLEKAQADADALNAQALANKNEAAAVLAEANALMTQAKQAQDAADAAQAKADKQADKAAAAMADAKDAMAAAQATKADILAKTKAFVEGL